MKKILLATTILGMTAGFAAADVKFSGSASMGVARDGVSYTANIDALTTARDAANLSAALALAAAIAAGENNNATPAEVVAAVQDSLDAQADAIAAQAALDGAADVSNDFHVYNSGSLDIAATVVSDAGVEFGMSTSVSFGNSYAFGDGADAFASEDGAIGSPTLTAKGAFGTLTFADDGVDQLYSDDTAGDVGFAYTAGDLSLNIVSDVDASTGVEWSASVGYTMSGVALSYTADALNSYNASASYTSGGITGTIETDSDAGEDAVNTLTVAYAANGMSVELSADSTDYTSIAVGYSANGLSVDVSTDSADEWEATTSYDLGGGATLVAGMNHGEEAYAGVDLSF